MREHGGGGGFSHFFLSAGGLACTDRYHTWVPLRASKGQVGRYSGVSIKIGKIKSLSCKVGEQKATKLGKLPWGSAVQELVVF